jgi:predicted dienelactone hydrolase
MASSQSAWSQEIAMIESFRNVHRFKSAIAWLIVLVFAQPFALAAQETSSVGMSPIRIPDPVNAGETDGWVFYPAGESKQGITKIGPYDVAATRDAAATPGKKPLVVISHGQGGSSLGHHDLATFLAAHGFVVATLNHPRDTVRDPGGVGTPAVMDGRPVQVSALITSLLADPEWKMQVDADRIGVAGFSMGGYTSLLLVGAVPEFDRIFAYCERHPEDKPTCRFAAKGAADPEVAARMADLKAGLTRWGPTADPRIKSAFAMAPLSLFFGEPGIAPIARPVFLYYGEHDEVLLPAENALQIKPWIKSLSGIEVVPKAGHWVFLTPCTTELKAEAATICTDPAGVDRPRVHEQVNAEALAFFRKTLDAAR